MQLMHQIESSRHYHQQRQFRCKFQRHLRQQLLCNQLQSMIVKNKQEDRLHHRHHQVQLHRHHLQPPKCQQSKIVLA
jgi:hypothetical protein